MKITLHLTRKNLTAVIIGVCLVGLAFISLHVEPGKLKDWQVAVWIIASIGVIGIAIQALMQSREDHQREEKEQERDARDKRIEENLQSMRDQLASKMESPLENEASNDAFAQFSPRKDLQHAQEAAWIEDTVKMHTDELKVNIAHDLDFRTKFYNTQPGNTPFDAIRDSIAKDPIIAATMVRSRLVPREPFALQIREIFDSMHKSFTSTSDFLFEVKLVNVTDNFTTVDCITVEAEIEGKWTTLKMSDLSNYEIVFDEEEQNGRFANATARIEQLPSLWDELKGVALTRGIAKQGWLDFAVEMPSTQLDKPVPYRVRIVDALGGLHPVRVLESKPLDPSGRIKHSKKLYAKLRS